MKIEQSISLKNFLKQIDQNIAALRAKLSEDNKSLDKIPLENVPSGNFYIESVGSTVEFDELGNYEFLYTPNSLKLRSNSLKETVKSRKNIYSEIINQFPKVSRILNIGAGGDSTIPLCIEDSGNEVISTDHSQETIDCLARKINSPVFACDLYHLNQILPPDSIDFFVGNSTLGYIDPKKLKTIINNISIIMKLGGVFTFDLTPHPIYFRLQENKSSQTVASESEVDPTKLIEFVTNYGIVDGINAMAVFSHYWAQNTNFATIILLKEIFEEFGMTCNISQQKIFLEGGQYKNQYLLRVSKKYPPILELTQGEKEPERFSAETADITKIWYRLAMIDRKNGEILAKLFGINKDWRNNPLNVAEFVNENQDPEKLPSEIKKRVLQEIDPLQIVEKVRPYLNDRKIPNQIPLPIEIQRDQILHKMFIDRTTDLTYEEIESAIDKAYLEERRKNQYKETKRVARQKASTAKNKRKLSQASRKKNRK